MKKFTAVLVMTALLCSFTACEPDTAYNVTDENEISETVLANDTYAEAIQTFLNCMNNHDAEGIMKMSYPNKYIDIIYLIYENNGESIEEEINNLAEELPETVRFVKVISEETLDDDDIEDFYEHYMLLQSVTDYIEENGKENIELEKIDLKSLPEPYFKLKDLCIVDCVLEYENENGGAFTAEQPFLMLDIGGEGWKTDISMIDFVKETRHDMVYVFSENLKTYSDWVLDYLAENDIEIPQKCTINSDSTKNENVPDEFLNSFRQALLSFNNGYAGLDYVIEIDNGCCVNAVCEEAFITTPRDENDEEMVHIFTFGDYTLEDIYNSGVKKIQKLKTKIKEINN